MIRLLRALAWLRWRQLVNGLKGGKRRDAMERVSRIMALVARVLLAVLLGGVTTALAVIGFTSGWLVGAGSWRADIMLFAARAVLFAMVVLLIVFPLGRANPSVRAGYTRLLLLPIPRRSLHIVGLLAGLVDPWVFPVIPALLLFSAGLLASGRAAAAAVALVGSLAFIAVIACLGSLVALLTDWLMRNRRRGEAFTLIFVLALTVVGMLPAIIGDRLEHRVRTKQRSKQAMTIATVDAALPRWTRALPSELYGHTLGTALGASPLRAAAGVGLLLVEAAVLYGLSSTVHRRLVGSAGSGSARRRGADLRVAALRLPWLTPAASAVAVTQARTALRSVRGRLVVLAPCSLVALFGVLARTTRNAIPGDDLFGAHGHALLGAGIVFSLYALQAFTMNQFASDRAGLTLQLLAPIPETELVKGKAVGCALILGTATLFCMLAALLTTPKGSPLAWLAVLLGGLATYAALMPLAALLSALFPVASDLTKTGTGGNPHGLAMLLGTLLVMVASVPPALIIGVVAHQLARPGLALLLTVLWTLVVLAIALPLLGLAARAVAPRRENLALVAQGK